MVQKIVCNEDFCVQTLRKFFRAGATARPKTVAAAHLWETESIAIRL